MKKIYYRLFICAVAAACAMTACKEQARNTAGEDPDLEEGAFQPVSKELTANAPDFTIEGQTKVGYRIDGSTMRFYWCNDDNIGFWPDKLNVLYGNPEQTPFYIKNGGSESNNARFESTTWGLIKGKHYYAYHPYNRSASWNNVRIHFNWQRQTANGSTAHLSRYDYMHTEVDVPADTSLNVNFKHLCCIEALTLTIPNEWRSCTFTSLELSTNSGVMVEEAAYNPSTASPSLTVIRSTSDMAISLGAENSTGIACDQNGKLNIYMAMCPALTGADWKGRTINLTLYTNSGTQFTGTIKPGISQKAGTVYPFEAAMEYNGPAIINLSQQETANCYVVSQAGDYKFRATKGNASEAVVPGSVKVLWESVNTTTAPANNTLIANGIRYEDGFIYFSTPANFTEGNAVVAAYSAANYGGDILWSWHIWFTDAPADEVYPNDAGVLMDRNLGALATSGNLANGMFYQWGRKDPITGAAATNSNTPMATNGSSIVLASGSASHGTVAYSITHPCSFIPGNSNGNGDWVWANPKAGKDYQITSPDVEKSLWYGGDEVKTKYDPCPPGYMVPYSGTSHSEPDFWGKAYGIAFRASGSATGFVLGGVSAPYAKNSGLSLPLANGSYSFYPTTGYIDDGGSRKHDGLHLMQWTSYPAGSDSNGNWNWQYSSCLDVNMDVCLMNSHWNSTRAVGKSVRCMRMRKALEFESSTGNESFGTPVDSAW